MFAFKNIFRPQHMLDTFALRIELFGMIEIHLKVKNVLRKKLVILLWTVVEKCYKRLDSATIQQPPRCSISTRGALQMRVQQYLTAGSPCLTKGQLHKWPGLSGADCTRWTLGIFTAAHRTVLLELKAPYNDIGWESFSPYIRWLALVNLKNIRRQSYWPRSCSVEE